MTAALLELAQSLRPVLGPLVQQAKEAKERRLGPKRDDTITEAVKAWLLIEKPRQGDLKAVCARFDVLPQSLISRVHRDFGIAKRTHQPIRIGKKR